MSKTRGTIGSGGVTSGVVGGAQVAERDEDTQKQGQRTSGASTSVQPEAEPSRTPATFSV
jgi:hypothetical protein